MAGQERRERSGGTGAPAGLLRGERGHVRRRDADAGREAVGADTRPVDRAEGGDQDPDGNPGRRHHPGRSNHGQVPPGPVDHIYVGVEATTQAALDTFNKNIKVEDSKRALDLINAQDIVSETSFVLGMPDDTPESMGKTLELAKYYNPDMAFFLAIAPWPYSEIYPSLKDHVEVTDYSRYNLVEPVVKPKNMTLKEVQDGWERRRVNFTRTR